jgi:lipoate-protein ligase A
LNGPSNPEDLPTIPYDLDDELMKLTRGDHQPRVRVYPWQGVAVVIGRGGKQHLELDRTAIAADGLPLYKRPGGGCAVVLDPGNIIVSVVLPLPGLSGITTAFGAISSWLAEALGQLDLGPVVQRGVSDLVVGDRKIGGSCIYRTRNLLYYSTTLLVQPDLDLVDRYLPHPPREPDYRRGRRHRDFMGQLAWEGKTSELASKLQNGLSEGLATLSESLKDV